MNPLNVEMFFDEQTLASLPIHCLILDTITVILNVRMNQLVKCLIIPPKNAKM